MHGHIYGIGVGPGDPELITLKGFRVLQEADIIAFPAPEIGESIARAIVAPFIPLDRKEIPIRIPILSDTFPAKNVYDRSSQVLSKEVDQGKIVAILCEGDPFFYGSFMYLFNRLAHKYPVTVVPGVSSLMACSAALSAPLSSRNDVILIIPAPLNTEIIEARIKCADSFVIVKVGRHFSRIYDILANTGLIDKAHYIEHATMENQVILPLKKVNPSKVPYFSMILVHQRGKAWK